MKQVLDNPSLGIKVIDVREAEGLTAKYPKYAKKGWGKGGSFRFADLTFAWFVYFAVQLETPYIGCYRFIYLKRVKDGSTAWSEVIPTCRGIEVTARVGRDRNAQRRW